MNVEMLEQGMQELAVVNIKQAVDQKWNVLAAREFISCNEIDGSHECTILDYHMRKIGRVGTVDEFDVDDNVKMIESDDAGLVNIFPAYLNPIRYQIVDRNGKRVLRCMLSRS